MALDDRSFLSGLSANAARAGDTSNLNPQFAANVAAAIREARAAGLPVGLASAYRTPGQTGSSFDASGRSLHSYGLATDISGLGGPNSPAAQQWAAIAARHGLYNPYGIGNRSEFNHWQALPYELGAGSSQLAALQAAARTGDWNKIWAAGNQLAGYGSTPTVASAPISAPSQGTTLNRTAATPSGGGVYGALANIESNNRNIPSGVDKDYPGQPGSKSQGYFQIDTPTWQQFGAKAGIDLNQYPNAMSAPREVQQQVAGLIPLSRFGGRTLRMLGQQYGPFDKSMTVGQLDQRFAKPGAMNMMQQQPTQPEGIVDPSIVARGGTSPPIPGTATTPTSTVAATQPQTVADKIRSLITPQQGQQGQQAQSPLGQLASSVGSAFKAPEPPKVQEQPPPSSAGEFAAQQARMQAAAPLFQQIVAQAGRPLTFTSAPPGAQAGLQQTPGTTLNTNPYAVGYGYGSVYGT